ncbi:hypothetical protein [Actinomycetospora soli]|uniref:hypothetical protein n=1 Tax=Actinomycetospora soli TaxID=2893887 RepID=UPI001E41A790|nr:hypothetical protein [Actinomycetospora soli]MCD2191612.1 hypothetical protein [Actinomycetospora soli]
MSQRSSAITGFWSERPGLDYVIALLAVALHIAAVRLLGGGDVLRWAELTQRLSAYGAGATLISVIGGLSSIAMAVYLSAAGPRVQAARRNYPDELRANWRSLLVGTGIAATACVAAQVLDSTNDVHSARFVFEGAVFLAVARFSRLIWLFDSMLAVADKDASEKGVKKKPAPELGSSWRQRIRN